MIEMFTYLRNIDIRSSASTTFKREDLRRGFEADESYYIRNAEAIRGKTDLDLSFDPPPDLVIEVDMTRSSIDKLQLFASMGISEMWRYDGDKLWVGSLNEETYLAVAESCVLPGFPFSLAEQLLAERADVSETELMRRFVNAVEQL
jgi:Uma2 family endonuclease